MIRVATTDDIPHIRTLMESVPGFWHAWWTDEVLAKAVESAGGLAFVCEDAGQIVGFICAHDFGFRSYLSELVVDSRARRKRIATRLLQAVEESLRKRGQQILISDVWRDAEPFYRARGWTPPDAILLRRKLGSSDRVPVLRRLNQKLR